MEFIYSYVALASVFVLLAVSANIMIGMVGIFSVSHAAVFGVGAYGTSVLMMAGLPFLAAVAGGMVCCITVSVLFALPALRVAGDYFVVTSFGIQLVASAVFENWSSVTGGTVGLIGIPLPTILGFEASRTVHFVLLNIAAATCGCLMFYLLKKSAFGRLLTSIRQDELAVAAAGKSIVGAKAQAAALAGGVAGLAGGFYAVHMSFIDPYSFDLHSSILIISMMVLGGTGTILGSIIGPFLLLGLPIALSFLDVSSSIAGPARQFVYGLLLVLFMLFRPQGIAGRRI